MGRHPRQTAAPDASARVFATIGGLASKTAADGFRRNVAGGQVDFRAVAAMVVLPLAAAIAGDVRSACTPAPAAKCKGAALAMADLHGADLQAIDLEGAALEASG